MATSLRQSGRIRNSLSGLIALSACLNGIRDAAAPRPQKNSDRPSLAMTSIGWHSAIGHFGGGQEKTTRGYDSLRRTEKVVTDQFDAHFRHSRSGVLVQSVEGHSVECHYYRIYALPDEACGRSTRRDSRWRSRSIRGY